MDIKWKNNKPKTWLGYLLVCIFLAVVSLVTYSMEPELQKIRENDRKQRLEQMAKQDDESDVDFKYYSDGDKMSLISNIYYLNYKMENMYDGRTSAEYLLKNNKTYKNLTSTEERAQYEEKARYLVNILYTVYRMDYGLGPEESSTYTYMYDKKRDISSGKGELADVIQKKDLQAVKDKYQSYVVLDFDEKGNPTITDSYNIEVGNFLNYLNNIKLQAVADYYTEQDIYIYEAEAADNAYESSEEQTYAVENVYPYEEQENVAVSEISAVKNVLQESAGKKISIDFPKIKNTQVVIGFVTPLSNNIYDEVYYDNAYNLAYIIVICAIVILFVGAVILQSIPYLGLKKQQIFCVPTELVAAVGIFGLIAVIECELPGQIMMYAKESFQYWLTDNNIVEEAVLVNHLPAVINICVWLLFYGVIYWGIANVLPYILHPIQNIMEKSIVVKVCRWVFRQCKKYCNYVTTLQAEKGLKSNIIKILAVNFILVSMFCCGWVVGIFGAVVYTIVLYILLVKKGGVLQKQYQGLLSMVTDMAKGELNAEVSDNLGVFEPIKQELTKVRSGFKHAVEEEVKSQNMKTELITNVSHDLKTPLTAIITYVDLLKNEELPEETRREYINTLDKKSQRLKVLIEDLFEVSKAASNNITMHYADVDFINLIKQVRLENEERIMDSDLIFRWNLPEEKCMLRLDPQRTYRIIENLLINALKYSMSSSRVYVDVVTEKETVLFTMKNISETELNFEAEKLTERFVRGDVSRNTEGSGLGLAIARSFTEIQGGKFSVEIDGDLFKVTVIFHK